MVKERRERNWGLLVFMILLAAVIPLSCEGGDPADIASEPMEESNPPPEAEAMPEPVIEGSSLTMSELETIIAPLDASIQKEILSQAACFLDQIRRAAAEPNYLTILVDKEHSLPQDYKPDDLVSLNDYPLAVSRNDLSLSRSIMPWVLALDEAAKADGLTLLFSSSFRSWEYQKGLYERYVSLHGQEEADRFSARPGHSQHQLGTVIDFGSITEEFAYTDAGKWMAQHAGRFGFSLSYPRGAEEETGYMWEPWHFRYVGPELIQLQETFFAGSQQKSLEFIHLWKNR
jgi:zinc D-Ala-D-Ala carboxypeptidase